MSFSELLHYLRLGGVTMVVLLVSSLLALAVALERVISLWDVGSRSRQLGDAVTRHLARGELAAARTAVERSDAPVADVFLAGLDKRETARGPDAAALVASAVERERSALGLRLRRNLWVLATIGSITPFVGLFGTVSGIMRSFKDLGLDVQAGGTGGTGAVMTGISEALIATAVGILVAVMAMVFYNYFQARLARLQVELRLLAEEFVEALREAPASPAPPASQER